MYTELAEIPFPTSAEFTDKNVIRVSYSVRDHTQNIKRALIKDIILTGSDESKPVPIVTSTQYAPDPKRTILSALSPSRTKRALLLESQDSKRRVEIWNLKSNKLEASLDVTDKHGAFYADDYLASSSFSPDETSFIYTAEGKAPDSSSDPSDPYAKFRFTPHFGEGFPGKRRPTLFLFKWFSSDSSTTSVVYTLKPTNTTAKETSILFGQAIFHPLVEATDQLPDLCIYATGYEYQPDGRLLGIKGCFNRPTGIWKLTSSLSSIPVEGSEESDKAKGATGADAIILTAQKLTPPNLSCRSPRIFISFSSPSVTAKLVWVSNPTGGAHASTSAVHTLDLPTTTNTSGSPTQSPEPRTILDIVDTPPKVVPEGGKKSSKSFGFPGFYPNTPSSSNLPDKPFIRLPNPSADSPNSTSGYIIASSAWGSQSRILLIPLIRGVGDSTSDSPPLDITPTKAELGSGSVNSESEQNALTDSWTVYGTNSFNRILAVRSSFVVPYELVVGTLKGWEEGKVKVDWVVLDKPVLSSTVTKALSTLQISIHPIPNRSPAETILIKTEGSTKDTPCVTVPHGGPHGTTFTGFNAQAVALALEGYTLSLPNYTGSLGYGESAVRALIGKCGTLDVEDCIASVRYLIDQGISSEGKGKQFVMGGSHGGFLTAHLIGQYPDMFSAAVLRNPVISVGELTSYDIPDWAYAEFGIDYPISSSPSIFANTTPSESTTTNATIPHMHPTHFQTLHSSSPIFHLSKITTPVLLLIGGVDLRVAPPTQGIPFYHALKARGVETDMLVFEGDSHPLEGVEAGKVGWEAGRDWFKKGRVD